MEKNRKRRGRPRLKPGDAKRASFNTRIREPLKVHLEAAAREAGRSLSEEIELRLEQSVLGGTTRMDQIFRALAAVTKADGYEEGWVNDYRQFNEVVDRWHDLLRSMAPAPSDEMLSRIKRYRETLLKLGDPTLTEEHRGRLREWAVLAANDTGLPIDLRRELAKAGGTDK